MKSPPLRSQPLATRLALAPVPPADAGSDSEDAASAAEDKRHPTRILVVEDDFLIGMQTEAALSEAGFDVVGAAATAEEAIALARKYRPDLVVMDIRLASRRDGIDAARELFDELNIRCIFATAHDDPNTRARAVPCAPLGWLAKPYTMASLVRLVLQARASLD